MSIICLPTMPLRWIRSDGRGGIYHAESYCQGNVPSARERTRRRIPTSQNFCVGNSLDPKLYIAFQILDYALCSAPGAPLKQALVDCGVGKDVYSIYENGIRQPYFSVVAKDTSVEKEQEFYR